MFLSVSKGILRYAQDFGRKLPLGYASLTLPKRLKL
jgi:hypothetical protein